MTDGMHPETCVGMPVFSIEDDFNFGLLNDAMLVAPGNKRGVVGRMGYLGNRNLGCRLQSAQNIKINIGDDFGDRLKKCRHFILLSCRRCEPELFGINSLPIFRDWRMPDGIKKLDLKYS